MTWKLWSEEKPTEPGQYWLAGRYDAGGYDGPYMSEVSEFNLSDKYDIQFEIGFGPDALVWCGPVTPPELPQWDGIEEPP